MQGYKENAWMHPSMFAYDFNNEINDMYNKKKWREDTEPLAYTDQNLDDYVNNWKVGARNPVVDPGMEQARYDMKVQRMKFMKSLNANQRALFSNPATKSLANRIASKIAFSRLTPQEKMAFIKGRKGQGRIKRAVEQRYTDEYLAALTDEQRNTFMEYMHKGPRFAIAHNLQPDTVKAWARNLETGKFGLQLGGAYKVPKPRVKNDHDYDAAHKNLTDLGFYKQF